MLERGVQSPVTEGISKEFCESVRGDSPAVRERNQTHKLLFTIGTQGNSQVIRH